MWAEPSPLAGREREVARLLDALAMARQGRGGVAFVSGEAGIGKTRLLIELAERARPTSGMSCSGVPTSSRGGRHICPSLRRFATACVPSRSSTSSLTSRTSPPNCSTFCPLLRRTHVGLFGRA